MPYFVFRIGEARKLDHLQTFSDYKEARGLVRKMREEEGAGSVETIRMIFAKNQTEAEKLLATPRDERVIGED
ncbi:MAG: hypothetical protein ABFS23_04120 [Pseudomonadota bacterium]